MAFMVCPKCKEEIFIKQSTCPNCGCSLTESNKIKEKEDESRQIKQDKEKQGIFEIPEGFNGIYKYDNGRKIPIYCPQCGSEECSYFQQQKIIPGKTKTKYTANLNPLKPFTLVNKKEKIVREEQIISESMIQCNKCGYIFK